MVKKNIDWELIIVIIVTLTVVCGLLAVGYHIGKANTSYSTGTRDNSSRERDLLVRIGEYQRREQIRIAAERDRITAENNRIKRARDRAIRTENALGAIRQSDRRSSDLLAELKERSNILEDYFRDTCSELGIDFNSE